MRRDRKPAIRLLAIVVGICTICSMPALALTDEEIFRQMRFNYIQPGARALGLGGAFIAVADDATAAEANPAGLCQLAMPEVFIEMRQIQGDRSVSDPFEYQLDTNGFVQASSNDRHDVTSPAFVSYVAPYRRFAWGFSRQEVMNTSFSVISDFEIEHLVGGAGLLTDTFRGTGDATVKLTHWNFAFAWKPLEWLSLGGTGTLGELQVRSFMNNTVVYQENAPGLPFGPLQLLYNTHIDDSDTAATFALGIMITPLESLSIGAVYHQDTEFFFDETLAIGSGISDPNNLHGIDPVEDTTNQTMHMPGRYGLGLKWRPKNNLTFALDGVRIEYSELLDSLQGEINVITAATQQTAYSYAIDDVTEIHFGAEYLFEESKRFWSLRAGIYTDPDNVLRADGEFSGPGGETVPVVIFPERDDYTHYTLGFGVVLESKLQLDAAVAFSEVETQAVVSLLYRF